MPGETIREQILDYIENDLLPLMRRGNGYYYEFKKDQIERFSMYGPASIDLPRVMITSGTESLGAQMNDLVECTFPVYLSIYIVHDEGDRISTDKHLNRLIGDVKKAVFSDNTLGGLVIDCVPVTIDPFSNSEGQFYAGVVAELSIKYRHVRTDPTKQS